jgi:hypothetical protein
MSLARRVPTLDCHHTDSSRMLTRCGAPRLWVAELPQVCQEKQSIRPTDARLAGRGVFPYNTAPMPPAGAHGHQIL